MFWSIVGLLSVSAVFYAFLKRLGSSIPILELLLLIAGLQWIVGAYIEYRTDFVHYKYYMYVKEPVYMGYVVPAYMLFTFFILYLTRKSNFILISISNLSRYSQFGVALFLIGLGVDLVKFAIPEQLNFVAYLIGNLKYVGAIILYFSDVTWHRKALYGAVLILMAQALISAMFHTFLIWLIFFFMFWAYQNKPSIKFSVSVILLGFLLSTAIQSVKSDYRTLVWSGYSGNKLSLFVDILSAKISGGLIDDKEQQEALNVRLNQGWIISAVMQNTEEKQLFARGETIFQAFEAAIVPRFLSQEKRRAESSENFVKYTGLQIGKNTSMGMSIIGEGYANFGKFGGILFMGIWGVFLALIWNFLINKASRQTVVLFFLPLIFLQVVKAETELLTVLNHIVKSFIFVFLFLWFWRTFINTNIIQSELEESYD